MTDIGLLNERPLHASLKEWYARPGDRFEVKVDGYFIDIVRNDLLVEIQTSGFASIRSKLRDLVRRHRIRLIHPVALERWIVKQARDDDGDPTRRKSPKKGRVEDIFNEMVSFPRLLLDPNFELEILMIREEEVRRFVGKRRWRSRGWGVEERRLLEVISCKRFEETVDWLELLPEALEEPFSTGDLAKAKEMNKTMAQKMAYCMRKVGVLEVVGKKGNSKLYEIAGA